MMTTKHLLVVGGTGFIGQHLVKESAFRGYKTTVLSLHGVDEKQRVDGGNGHQIFRGSIGRKISHQR